MSKRKVIQQIEVTTPRAMAWAMESILEHALNGYFRGAWDESVLENNADWIIDNWGCETLVIGGNPLIKFHPVNTHVEVENHTVTIRMSREYESFEQRARGL